MPEDAAAAIGSAGRFSSARSKLLVSSIAGVLVGAAAEAVGAGRAAPLIGWDVLAVLFCLWMWITIWNLDGPTTNSHALRENPGRDASDLILLGAAVASLIAVGVVLFGAGHAAGNDKFVQAGFAVFSVFVSWTLIHTVFTLKYARLYYTGTPGGIDFNESAPPQYSDFAYLSFTIGMTFQVSDTDLQTPAIRATAVRSAVGSPLRRILTGDHLASARFFTFGPTRAAMAEIGTDEWPRTGSARCSRW